MHLSFGLALLFAPQNDTVIDEEFAAQNEEQNNAGDDVESWCEEVASFIKKLVKRNVVTDLNQIAFLFHSVKNKDVVRLSEYLESKGIEVFSPRSAQFFTRDVVRRMIGLFFFIFPQARKIPEEMSERQPIRLNIIMIACDSSVNLYRRIWCATSRSLIGQNGAL